MLQTYNDLHPETTYSYFVFPHHWWTRLCIEWLPLTNLQNELHLPLCSVLLCSCFSFSICFSVSNAVSFLFLGMVVVADSPLLSTLVAQNAPAEIKELRLQL
jgi:hypothetical protein